MDGPCRLEKTTSVFTAFLTDSCSFCRLDPRWQTGVVCRPSDRRGLTRNVTVPVLAGLLTDTDSCLAALTAYREGDTAPIVRRVSKAAVGAVFNGRQLVSEFHCHIACGPGWDRTSDLPRVKRSFGLRGCVSAGQTGSDSRNWAGWTN
jgi:hypothetical protein